MIELTARSLEVLLISMGGLRPADSVTEYLRLGAVGERLVVAQQGTS